MIMDNPLKLSTFFLGAELHFDDLFGDSVLLFYESFHPQVVHLLHEMIDFADVLDDNSLEYWHFGDVISYNYT